MKKVRIGIDFGYKYTGIALLDQDNKVLEQSVIQHKNISKTLLQRRVNRSARRRKHTQKVRLRNFYALLKGMGVEPKGTAGKSNVKDKKFIGNQLYAMAHRRGWDYSSLVELLVNENGKTVTVRNIDLVLIGEFGAPHTEVTKKKGGEEYTVPQINTTCMGELAEYQKIINDKKSTEDEQQDYKILYEELHHRLDNADLADIKSYIKERVKKSGVATDDISNALEHVMVMLGLNIGQELHAQGKLYTPHRNRHRNEFVVDLKAMMERAFDEPTVQQKAKQMASSQDTTIEQVKKKWGKNAIAIMDPNNPDRGGYQSRKKNNKDIRPARFQNRHTGKCPATLKYGDRCSSNLPKKSREDIRKLQFEIEARQMNVKNGEGVRKLSSQELGDLMACVDFKNISLVGTDDGTKWDEFFKNHKTPRVKEDARGKKDILKDIATSGQGGRSGLCKKHLQEKLHLLTDSKTESDEWKKLHQERRLSIFSNDAPPSIHQKVHLAINTIKKLLEKQGYDLNKPYPSIEHIGIETARFDISALAQNEGRKLKKKNYQKKSTRKIEDLREEQNNKCLYCGIDLGFATIDHIFPKARSGSDWSLNRAAAHDLCNINKGKGFVEINPNVLSAIKENNPRKYRYIQKCRNENWSLCSDSLAGAQHTMFGAKLLKGSLIDALGLKQLSEKEINKLFPKINSRETSLLRKEWFPLMNKQKSAIRYKDKKDTFAIKIVIDGNPPKPLTINWGKNLLDNIDIQLENPERLKNWISYKTKNRITVIVIDEDHTFKQGDECILSYRFNAIDKPTGEIKQYRKLHIIISSAKNDGIHEYHHAVDAIVCATKVEWSKLHQINHQYQTDSDQYQKKFRKAIKSVVPCFSPEQLTKNSDGECVSPDRSVFFLVDKQEQSGDKRSKTDTQAISRKDGKITQRKALISIYEKNVKNIESHRIRSLMTDAFLSIRTKSDEEQKKCLTKSVNGNCITQDYFLSLSQKHFLHPTNTRNVRCKIDGTGDGQMFKVIDKNTQGKHYYKRSAPWDKAVVYECSEKGKKKLIADRFKEDFYVNKHNSQTRLPEGVKVIAELKRGDKVEVNGQNGVWVISKLNKNGATLRNSNNEISKAYTKLIKITK